MQPLRVYGVAIRLHAHQRRHRQHLCVSCGAAFAAEIGWSSSGPCTSPGACWRRLSAHWVEAAAGHPLNIRATTL